MLLPMVPGSWVAVGGKGILLSLSMVRSSICVYTSTKVTFASSEAGFGSSYVGGESSNVLGFQPWTTEVLSLVAMNSASFSAFYGHPSTSPVRHRPRHLPGSPVRGRGWQPCP